MIRILVADDHELVRRGLVSVLEGAHPDWEIIAEAADGDRAVSLGESLRPDIAILDLSMPGLNGLRVTERLTASVPGIRILVLTVHTAEPVMRQLKRAGAGALMAKSEAPRKLVAAVENLLAGEPFQASESASRSVLELGATERVPVQYLLTPRELEVLRLLAEGKSNKEIAGSIEVSVRTVESHRADIMTRLAVDSLGELVRLAVRDGVI